MLLDAAGERNLLDDLEQAVGAIGRQAMSRTATMTIRTSGTLSDFVAANVGEDGAYENVSEYIRDLIRRVQDAAALRLEEIYRDTRDRWGEGQAEACITGLLAAFEQIETRGVVSRSDPAEFGVEG